LAKNSVTYFMDGPQPALNDLDDTKLMREQRKDDTVIE